jgi:hypothetical protein
LKPLEPIRIRSRRETARAPATGRTWLPIGLAAIVIVVAALAITNIVRSVAAPSPEPVAVAPGPATTGAPPESAPLTEPVAAPNPAPPDASVVRVANTDGEGAFVRRTTNLDDKLRAWPDGTQLKVTGPDVATSGVQWRPVEDPAGNRGWIPAQYTTP